MESVCPGPKVIPLSGAHCITKDGVKNKPIRKRFHKNLFKNKQTNKRTKQISKQNKQTDKEKKPIKENSLDFKFCLFSVSWMSRNGNVSKPKPIFFCFEE